MKVDFVHAHMGVEAIYTIHGISRPAPLLCICVCVYLDVHYVPSQIFIFHQNVHFQVSLRILANGRGLKES
jgi:hypothetical protein